jgi:hypothetical protein
MYNSLLLPGTGTNGAQNNTFLDGSTNNFTITRYGNTTQGTFSPYGPNWSNYFDGNGDYLTAPSSANFTFPGNFTIECWIYVPSVSQTIQRIFSSNAGPNGACFFSVGNDTGAGGGAGKLCANGQLTYPYYDGLITAPTAIPTNTWIHAALVRSGSTVTIYQNGVSVASGTNSATWDFNNSAGIRISGTPWSGTEDLGGYISNLRVVKGTAVYTSNFTPSTTPLTAIANTSLLTCQSNRFIDNSTNAFAITVNGNTNIQRFSPFSPSAAYDTSTIGGSGYFDGSGDYLSAPSNAAFNVSSNNVTAEAWVYLIAFNTGGNPFISTIWSLDSSGSQNTFAYIYNTGAIAVGINGVNEIASSAGVIKLGAWYHTAVVRNGSTTTVYVNGVSVASNTTSVWANTGARPFLVGSTTQSANYYLNGYISNMRFVNGTAVYTSAFTPPTAPVTAITNTSILLNYTNAGIIDNTMINNLETVGNAQISTAQSQFGGGSMSFDGTGDYMIGGAFSSTVRAIGSGNFTIEMWLYTNANKIQILFDTGTTSGSTTCIQCALNSSGYPYVVLNNSPALTSSIVVSTGTWTHVAWVRSSGTLVIYVNGVSGGSVSNSTNISDTGLTIGTPNDWRDTSASYHYNGYIDDLRVTNGYARYTSNFTPPTSAFPTY